MGLSRERVLRAAVELIDEQGLSGLSMRGLAARLGVEAMSLYHYVRKKSDLLDGVFEAIVMEVRLPAPSGVWRQDAQRCAQALYEVLWRHPRALPLFATRPAATAVSLERLEEALALLGSAGLESSQALFVFQTVFAFVIGHVITHFVDPDIELTLVRYDTLDPQRFPLLTNLGSSLDAYDSERAFDAGIQALLDGLEARIEGATT